MCRRLFAYSQDFCKICWKVEIWSVVLRPEQNCTATGYRPVVIQVFYGIPFPRHLVCVTLFQEAKERDVSIVTGLNFLYILCMGMITPV